MNIAGRIKEQKVKDFPNIIKVGLLSKGKYSKEEYSNIIIKYVQEKYLKGLYTYVFELTYHHNSCKSTREEKEEKEFFTIAKLSIKNIEKIAESIYNAYVPEYPVITNFIEK